VALAGLDALACWPITLGPWPYLELWQYWDQYWASYWRQIPSIIVDRRNLTDQYLELGQYLEQHLEFDGPIFGAWARFGTTFGALAILGPKLGIILASNSVNYRGSTEFDGPIFGTWAIFGTTFGI